MDSDFNIIPDSSADEKASTNKFDTNSSMENNADKININDTINEASNTLRNINVIREELCKLSLNPCEREYFNNCILPLISILTGITSSSVNLATSASYLSNSNILFRKKSSIKDTLDLAYDMNKKSEEIYKDLVKRIDKLLDCIE